VTKETKLFNSLNANDRKRLRIYEDEINEVGKMYKDAFLDVALQRSINEEALMELEDRMEAMRRSASRKLGRVAKIWPKIPDYAFETFHVRLIKSMRD